MYLNEQQKKLENFRKYEIWEDYWCFEPISEEPLNFLKTLNYYSWKPRENDKINIRIESFNNTELPRKNQVKTFEFIIKNQNQIINGIWEYYKNLILPIYQSAIDIEEEQIAKNKSELSKVFGVKAIEIPPCDNYGSYYFLIEFDFQYDSEHGLYLMFKDDKPIDLFGEGDKNYESIDIYEKGLYNKDKMPLKINISSMNGKTILKGNYLYNEQIEFKILKGAYRIFYVINNTQCIRNFIVTENMDNFTLDRVLRNCEK